MTEVEELLEDAKHYYEKGLMDRARARSQAAAYQIFLETQEKREEP